MYVINFILILADEAMGHPMTEEEYWHGFENGVDAMFLQVEDGGEVVDWIVVSRCHVSNPFLVLITLLLLSNLEASIY